MEKPSAASAGGNEDNGGKRVPIEVPFGFTFDPTDEGLKFYLRNQIMGGCDDLPDYIPTADVFGTSPNQLPFEMEKPSAASARGNDDSGGKRTRIEVPVGCKFDPTDEELMFYLKNKILGGHDDLPDYIPNADVFGTSPDQLPFDSCEYSTGEKWFFYTVAPNDNVFTGDGYWTPTSEKAIYIDGQVDGYKKEFIYYRGTEHPGKRTNWCIYQFRLNPDVYVANAVGNIIEYKISSIVACMVFRKEAIVQSNRRKRKRKNY